jgi:hypothetical protein
MRQILIEKYVEPSETKINKYGYIEQWHNDYGELHSFMGHPSLVYFYKGKILAQHWYKKDVKHREKSLPAEIVYDKKGLKELECWVKNDQTLKETEYINGEKAENTWDRIEIKLKYMNKILRVL